MAFDSPAKLTGVPLFMCGPVPLALHFSAMDEIRCYIRQPLHLPYWGGGGGGGAAGLLKHNNIR